MPSKFTTVLIAVSGTLALTFGVAAGGDAVAAAQSDQKIASWSPSDLRVSKTLNPVTIGACNAGFGDVSVAALNAKGFGKIDLKCGHEKAGYVHIRTRHQRDWQTLVDQAGGGAPWDDLMMFALAQATSAPMTGFPRATPRDANKLCYVTPIQLKNRQGRVIKTFYPSVVVSKNNRIVITNFPTTTPYCN